MNYPKPSCSCILLAAGLSKRFGSQKLLHSIEEGKTVIELTLEPYLSVFPRVYVVVSENEQLINKASQPQTKLIVNRHPENGMSESIRLAIDAIASEPKNNDCSYIIALADMPFIQTSTLKTIYKKLTSDEISTDKSTRIVAPYYQGKRGNPIGLGAYYKSALLNLNGDIGARKLIQENMDLVDRFNCSDEGILIDIDDFESLAKARTRKN